MKKFYLIMVIIFVAFTSKAQVNLLWAKSMGGPGVDRGQSVVVDASGNVYTAGYFGGTVDFDPGVGVYTLTTIGGYNVFISKLDPLGNFVWAKSIGGTFNVEGYAITLDGSGNIYTTGRFLGTADFDPNISTYTLTSNGNYDIFVSKLDMNGNFIWAKNMGGTSNEEAHSIAIDGSGNVYTTGTFYGTADFDPNLTSYTLAAVGIDRDVFVSKLNSSGNFLWAKSLEGANYADYGSSIVLDALGNSYTTGQFTGVVDFDPGTGIFNLTASTTNIFILKLDINGNFNWAERMGDPMGYAYGQSITLDASGNIYTTGYFQGIADFDPGVGTYSLTSTVGSGDIFVSKLNSAGNFVWAKNMGGTTYDGANSISVDASGNVYTTGIFSGTSDFDPGAGTFNLTSIGNYDIFISKLNSSGNFVSANKIGGTNIDEGNSITVDASSNIYLTGCFSGIANFDPNLGTYNLSSAGNSDIFVEKFCQMTVNALTNNTLLCLGQSATLTATGAATYSWNTGATTAQISVTPTVTTVYTVTGTNGSCSNTKTVSVTVTTAPVVNATTSNSLICAGQTVTLSATGAISYTFNPGGITGNPIALTPTVSITYTVLGNSGSPCTGSSLIVQNISACTGVEQISTGNMQLEVIPNPNNGQFIIKTDITDAFDVSIYNSIGQLIKFIPQNKSNVNIDLSNYGKGMYNVLFNVNGNYKNLKVIVE